MHDAPALLGEVVRDKFRVDVAYGVRVQPKRYPYPAQAVGLRQRQVGLRQRQVGLRQQVRLRQAAKSALPVRTQFGL